MSKNPENLIKFHSSQVGQIPHLIFYPIVRIMRCEFPIDRSRYRYSFTLFEAGDRLWYFNGCQFFKFRNFFNSLRIKHFQICM